LVELHRSLAMLLPLLAYTRILHVSRVNLLNDGNVELILVPELYECAPKVTVSLVGEVELMLELVYLT
jgi:hypothetical protein